MKILVTGDRGYIGSVLVNILRERNYEVLGYDIGYFSENKIIQFDEDYEKITKDIRHVTPQDLNNIDAVIHLAGLSNDPLGEFSPKLTNVVNFESTLKLATLSRAAGVKRFIYSSSQSMYGISDLDDELDEDNSLKNPVTAYAIAKWEAEKAINKMSNEDFIVTSFRPSTVFGASPRLRCDIVFNNLVACAYTTGKIEILSDGTPWRPVVHIQDVCSAFIAGLEAPRSVLNGRSFNVGVRNGNFCVRDLAEAAQKVVPGSELVFTGEHGSDSRTYRVSFDRILNELSDYYQPQWSLERGGKELVDLFKYINLTEDQFRGKACVRLKQLNSLLERNIIDEELRMIE